MIDYFDRAIQIRNNLMNSDSQVLCVNFESTVQKKDIHRDLIKDVCIGFIAKVQILFGRD